MEDADTLIQLIEQPLNNHFKTPLLYWVKGGDTLSHIISKHYDITYNDPRYKVAQASVLYFNDTIKHPDAIYSGQLLRLMPLPDNHAMGSCPVPDDFYKEKRALATSRHRLEPMGNYRRRFQHHIPSLPKEQDAFWALAWLHENYNLLSTAGGAGFNAFGGVVAQSNNAFIGEVKSLYNQYQRGNLTQNQYSYRRQRALKQYAQKIGPFEKLLFKGKTASEVARISRTKALPATAKIDHQLHRLGRMAQNAKYGGTVLTVAGVGMGCYNIGQAQSRQQKNEIFVETFGSTVVSIGTTVAIGIYFIATPTGWVTALALGASAAALSMGAGTGLKSLYNQFGQKVDIVSGLGVDKLC
jgi:hypothetical protein